MEFLTIHVPEGAIGSIITNASPFLVVNPGVFLGRVALNSLLEEFLVCDRPIRLYAVLHGPLAQVSGRSIGRHG